ncbi:MAG: hypothetical protein LBE91_02840, partial [Tannerella sp.]|nr:hypothetical protein [Tannerella sp.]
MRASEIYRKYYHDIASPDFEKIVSADAVSSSLQRDKLGKYAKWMLDLYRRKYLKMEDLYKATDYIAVFDKASRMRRLPDTDLNHYKSLPDMYRIIEPFIEVKSKTEKVRNIRESEAEKLFEDFVFTVIHPKTRAASVLYGKGTQWCTAARKYNNFRYYNESGKLYIIINKLSGRKYQFHVESESFMDENDRPLTDGG